VNVKDKAAITTGIANQSQHNELLTIYPNPSNGMFTLELSGVAKDAKTLNISLYNMLGEKVLEITNVSPSSQSMDVSALSNGTYFVKVRSDNGHYTKKIMIQK
jgi:type IX secretion system substrate protein